MVGGGGSSGAAGGGFTASPGIPRTLAEPGGRWEEEAPPPGPGAALLESRLPPSRPSAAALRPEPAPPPPFIPKAGKSRDDSGHRLRSSELQTGRRGAERSARLRSAERSRSLHRATRGACSPARSVGGLTGGPTHRGFPARVARERRAQAEAPVAF